MNVIRLLRATVMFFIVVVGCPAITEKPPSEQQETSKAISKKIADRIEIRKIEILSLEILLQGPSEQSKIFAKKFSYKNDEITKKRLSELREEQRRDRTELNFITPSIFTGRAMLKNPSTEESGRQTVNLIGINTPVKQFNERNTFGLGVFVGVELDCIFEDVDSYVGVGISMNGRVSDSSHYFSFGVGYGIDNKNTGIPDRTGLFFMVSIDAASSLDALTRQQFRKFFN